LGIRNEELALTMEEGIRQMLENRIKLCKKAGVKEVSYIIRTGKPADEIVRLVGERYYDLIVMASSRISLTIRITLGSNAKRILDSPSYGTKIFLYAVLVRGKAILFGLYILL
jgi:nucleotide-binding universal stress UspA family protein